MFDFANVQTCEKNSVTQPLAVVSEEDAVALLQIMFERGYFHMKIEKNVENAMGADSSSLIKYKPDDAILIETTNQNSYVTVNTLVDQFQGIVCTKGRFGVRQAAEALSVSEDILRSRIVPLMMQRSPNELVAVETANMNVIEVLAATYIRDMSEALWSRLQEQGRVSISEAAHSLYHLPNDMTMNFVQERMASDCNVQILLDDHGAKVLVTNDYLDRLRNQVEASFRACTMDPVDIRQIVKSNAWELGWILRIIHNFPPDVLPGEFRGETYIPLTFTETKRQGVIDYFNTNGFVTSHVCHALFGISPSEMKHHLKGSATLVLPNTVVHPDMVVAPLVGALHEAINARGWLDLQMHLPLEILEYQTEDARTLVEKHALETMEGCDTSGFVSIRSDGAIFFSQNMVDDFLKNRLAAVVNACAKKRALEMIPKRMPTESSRSGRHKREIEDPATHMTGKEKRKTRMESRANYASCKTDTYTVDFGMISLEVILKAVMEAYPDLEHLDSTGTSSVFTEVCKLAFCTDNVVALYENAVRAELDRIENSKQGLMSKVVNQKDMAINFKTVQAAFEDPGCFANACYMIQAMHKFLCYAMEAESLDDNMKTLLQKDFLVGCCADFTSRVTQFALHKSDIDSNIFSFADEAPLFYSPIDLAARMHPRTYLSAGFDQVGSRNDPLKMIRESLAGSVGVALARQWILCGGENYQGGVKPAVNSSTIEGYKSGNCEESMGYMHDKMGLLCGHVEHTLECFSSCKMYTYTRPGNAHEFVKHVQDNCLTMCGIPFSKLDKKAEKRFLNMRRKCLVSALEHATKADDVLDLSIMLVYQLVKNMVVAGPLLRGPVLQLLMKERKVSDDLAKELCDIADQLKKGCVIDEEKIEYLKGCGLP